MTEWLANQTRSLTQFFRSKDQNRNKFNDDQIALVDAHRDWLAAREFFEQATDPDLVDYAILSLQAAERRYVYLWKKCSVRVIKEGNRWLEPF